MSEDRKRHALVIGAGLGGAAVAAALVQRGWQVSLLDAAEGPARAASALPVGMLSPHVTRVPTPLSRLSALGVADMHAELRRVLPQGQGWQACEVDNLGHDPGRWPAALVRPAAVVQAWLDEARQTGGLSTRWNAAVARLERTASGLEWQALNADGEVLAQAPHAVVAGAHGSLALLMKTQAGLDLDALPLRPVKGQMSLGRLDGPPLAERPQRNNGVYVPAYADSGLPPSWPGRIWSMGSTYVRGDSSTSLSDAGHEQNLQSLQGIHPAAAVHMRAAAERGELMGWAQVRCASLDRLPLMGAVPDMVALRAWAAQAGHRRSRLRLSECPRLPGLFTLTALGSRGLTLAHWAGQQLAAVMNGQAPAVETDLLQALDPARFAWRHIRRQDTARS